jgi:hypothetical protein
MRVTLNKPAPAATADAPQRVIPIRNLAPPPKKKGSMVTKFATAAAVLVLLGAGVYFGYPWISGMQNKVDQASKDAAKNADGGQVGHIGKLYGALDATDPNRVTADARAAGPRQRRSGVGREIPIPAGSDTTAGSTNSDSEPLIPVVWTMDLTKARIVSSRANGQLSGTNFVPETARIDPVGNAQILRLVQGQVASPDREILIYLHLKPGEKLGGQNLSVSQDTIPGAGVPQVTKRWKNNPRYAPQYKSFTSGYAMKLELGEAADGSVPGKIFLALPDPEQSVVAGGFKATIVTNVVADATAQSAPVMAPTPASPTADAAFQARYGIRRSQ